MTAAEYFANMKILVDTMALVGQPLQDEELISYILMGLNSDCKPLVTSITTRLDTMSINDVYAHLLAFEMRLDIENSGFQLLGASANTAMRGGRGGRG